MTLVVAVVVVVVAVASYLTWMAGRLDRLAVRVDAARAGLDAALVRRAAAAETLARALGRPDLAAVASVARTAGDRGREGAENDLGRVLRAVLAATDPAGTDPGGDYSRPADDTAPDGTAPDETAHEEVATAAVVAAAGRVHLARQFHNDAVRDLLALRGRPLVRVLHLYGRARPPAYFEIDDDLPLSPPAARRRPADPVPATEPT